MNESYIASDVNTNGGSFLADDTDFTVPENEFFLMGDNREHSSDSRFWGPVPLNLSPNSQSEGINGRAWVIYWPLPQVGFTHSPTYSL